MQDIKDWVQITKDTARASVDRYLAITSFFIGSLSLFLKKRKEIDSRTRNYKMDEIYDEVVSTTETLKRNSKNKIQGRQDSKRSKESYISANKKAAKKCSVNTESEAAELNDTICKKRH